MVAMPSNNSYITIVRCVPNPTQKPYLNRITYLVSACSWSLVATVLADHTYKISLSMFWRHTINAMGQEGPSRMHNGVSQAPHRYHPASCILALCTYVLTGCTYAFRPRLIDLH